MAESIFQFLLDHIPDHALGFRAQDIQRVGLIRLVGRALQGQQPDLRTVAMGDHQVVAGTDNACQRKRGGFHVAALDLGRQRFSAFQEGVTPQSCHNQHVSLPASPLGRP